MNEEEAKQILKKDLNFSENNINNLEIFRIMLIEYNAKYNLISKSTENSIWSRHILDSAQLLKYFNVSSGGILDLVFIYLASTIIIFESTLVILFSNL